MRQLNQHSINPGIEDLWVDVYDDTKRKVPATTAQAPDGTWLIQFDNGDPTPPGVGLNVRYGADGYAVQMVRQPMPPDNTQIEANAVELKAGSGPFPLAPSREQVCGLRLSFEGLTVATREHGIVPWFEPGYQCLGPEDRAAVRAVKKAAGDTHLILEFFSDAGSIYDEPGQPFEFFISPSMEQNPAFFLSLVEEVIQGGFVPVITFDGDDADDPDHGYPNALRQLPILVNLLRSSVHGDLNAYVLYARFWDGVFYGSTPANIGAFGQAFRALLPNGYLAIEHQPGRIPCGEGGGDYAAGGLMTTYDTICGEYDWPPNADSTWQVIGRMVSPYTRPPDQPAGDDPHPPFYLAPGSPRGPYFYCAFEDGEYQWVRGQVTLEQIQTERQYFKDMGCTYTG